MYKKLLCILFSFFLVPAYGQRARDTFRLYFDIGISALNKGIENKIDALIFNDKIISGSKVMIVGYADFLGTEGRNKDLSIKRAENVKKYLAENGVNPNDITLCEGKGEVERTGIKDKGGFPSDRRVDIVVNNKTPKKERTDKPKNLPKKDTTAVIVTNIAEISHLKPGTAILLKDVYFPSDRHTIMEKSYETLRKLYDVLEANPKLKISIEGHVCCIKNAPDALDIETNEPTLSVNRAKEIYYYLINRGIDPIRLKYSGYGRSRPVVPEEKTDQDREKNRRVEMRIIDNK